MKRDDNDIEDLSNGAKNNLPEAPRPANHAEIVEGVESPVTAVSGLSNLRQGVWLAHKSPLGHKIKSMTRHFTSPGQARGDRTACGCDPR
ncbi:hypothetical protein GCM10009608_33820 [Pseudonocardia alaniniphila]